MGSCPGPDAPQQTTCCVQLLAWMMLVRLSLDIMVLTVFTFYYGFICPCFHSSPLGCPCGRANGQQCSFWRLPFFTLPLCHMHHCNCMFSSLWPVLNRQRKALHARLGFLQTAYHIIRSWLDLCWSTTHWGSKTGSFICLSSWDTSGNLSYQISETVKIIVVLSAIYI